MEAAWRIALQYSAKWRGRALFAAGAAQGQSSIGSGNHTQTFGTGRKAESCSLQGCPFSSRGLFSVFWTLSCVSSHKIIKHWNHGKWRQQLLHFWHRLTLEPSVIKFSIICLVVYLVILYVVNKIKWRIGWCTLSSRSLEEVFPCFWTFKSLEEKECECFRFLKKIT